jgi:hypothetical protein
MDPEESARQVFEAYADFLDDDDPLVEAREHDMDCLFAGVCRDTEQPINFDNREIKDILPHEL